MKRPRPVIAVCGKGGVGKTVFTSLLARVLLDSPLTPLLLIDADPVGGLIAAIGEEVSVTLGDVRRKVIDSFAAREDGKEWVARSLDYLLLEALTERDEYSLLSAGQSRERGCFCPVNRLLREALGTLTGPFGAVLVDAEAGLEQINREVTKSVTDVVVIVDGSRRSLSALRQIDELVPEVKLGVVANRGAELGRNSRLPARARFLGSLPEDELVRSFDIDGKSLWELPSADSAALDAVRGVAELLMDQG